MESLKEEENTPESLIQTHAPPTVLSQPDYTPRNRLDTWRQLFAIFFVFLQINFSNGKFC